MTLNVSRWYAALVLFGLAAGLALASAPARAEAASEKQPAAAAAPLGQTERALKSLIEKRLNVPRVDAVVRLPYSSQYEVRIGTDIIYADASGNHMFVGNIIDTRTMENKTRTRVEALVEAATPKARFADLPLDSAIKFVNGKGTRHIAVFSDPNCSFCKRFEKTLQELPDVTIHVFLYPVLGADSVQKAKSVWCSPDRAKAWLDWMLSGVVPTAPGTCANPVETLTALGRSLRINGTPTTLFTNGKRVAGAIPSADLQKMVAQSSS